MLNFIAVSFPNSSVPPIRVSEMTLWQERFKHEFATFRFRDWDTKYDDIRPGTPATFSLETEDGYYEFDGYVHHINPTVKPGTQETEVSLIGASYLLKQGSQQVYYDLTASDIVTKIAKRNKFAYSIDSHPLVYPQLSQAGLTDFEMINKLAKHCGYTVRFHNAEIYFQSITKLYEEERENAPIYVMRDAQNPKGSTLYSFTPIAGESIEYDNEYKSATAVAGVDAYTGKIIQVTNQKRPKAKKKRYEPEFFDRFDTTTVANSYDLANFEAIAVDERVKFTYRAIAEVLGDPKAYPNMPVFIDGIGDPYGGYWIVLKAEHRIVSKSYNNLVYTTVLHLGSDSLGQAVAGKDNRLIVAPNSKKKRTIIPNVRQTNKNPVNKLSSGSLLPSKSSPVGLGNTKNRTAPKVANRTVVAKKWTSPSGNLKKTSTTKGRSAAVVNKLRGSGAL